MLCDRVRGNIGDQPTGAGEYDFVDLTWDECGKRALRKQSAAGFPLKILLPLGTLLKDGDILLGGEREKPVVVRVLPCEVLVARPRDALAMAVLAIEVGNLHAPAEVTEAGELVLLPDGPVEALLEKLGVAHEMQMRRFSPLRSGASSSSRFSDTFQLYRR